MAIDSPRRSPRIASRASIEGIRDADEFALSPLTARSTARQNQQSQIPDTLPIRKHPRASTSAETSSPTAKKANKLPRRAYSVGGVAASSYGRKLSMTSRDDLTVPSRRNVPGPRKSAIRALPPQVFLSPSELSPPHSARPLFSRKSLGLEAFGGSDLMKMMESIGILRSPRNSTVERPQVGKLSAKMPRKSAPAAGPVATEEHPQAQANEDKATVERKRRRVTFNPFQEKANFEKDEPTMRIRPASDADLIRAAEMSTSDTSTSTSTSQSVSESSDMSLDSSSERTDDEEEKDEDEDSESEAEVEGHLGPFSEGNTSETSEDADETATIERQEQSAMDMTTAYGGMQSATMTGAAYGFTADDTDSESAMETDSQSDASSATEEVSSNTMQLTEVHNEHTFYDDITQLSTASAVGMDSEMEVEEEDDVEKQLVDSTPQIHSPQTSEMEMDLTNVQEDKSAVRAQENSASMELMDVLQQSLGNPTLASRLSSQATKTDMSPHRSPSVKPSSPMSSPKKPVASSDKASLPLQSRSIPNSRVSRSPSPNLKKEGEVQKAIATSPLRPFTPSRRSTLHQRESSSPRRGHEHCKIPAAESPKPRVSLATLRSQARRAASPSPRKSMAASLRTSIGKTSMLRSPEKLPFRASVRDRSRDDETVERAKPPENKQVVSPASSQRPPPSQPIISSERPTTPESPVRRSNSPLRPHNSPSRAWQSFREEQRSPTMPNSPARRISMPAAAHLSHAGLVPGTFGSPQRIAVKSDQAAPARKSVAAADHSTRPSTTNEQFGVTMKEFFDSLNMGFLDLSLPAKRRVDHSTAKSSEGASSVGERMRAACVDIPALDSLLDASKELKESVDDGREVLLELEREFHQNPPSYVAEVLAMNTSQERQKAIASFKLQKSAARAIALRAYYGWRTDKQFDDATLAQLTTIRDAVTKDAEHIKREAQTLNDETLPLLRNRRADLLADMKRARSRHAEISAWDSEEMQAMHEAMTEQSVILDEQRAAHGETRSQLDRLRVRIEEIEARKRSAQEAIATAHASSSAIHGSTRAEASRLAHFVRQLEALQQWSIAHVSPEALRIELEADSGASVLVTMRLTRKHHVDHLTVEALCDAHFGILAQCHTSTAVKVEKALREQIATSSLDPTQSVRQIGLIWARLRHVLAVAANLQTLYPTTLALFGKDEEEAIEVRSIVLLDNVRAKAEIKARCEFKSLLDIRAPLFSPSSVTVERIYGHKNASAALLARISDALLCQDTEVRDGFNLADSIHRAVNAMSVQSTVRA